VAWGIQNGARTRKDFFNLWPLVCWDALLLMAAQKRLRSV